MEKLKEVMDEEIEILTSEYKNWTLNHINYLNEQKLQHLNDLFSFDNLKIEILCFFLFYKHQKL